MMSFQVMALVVINVSEQKTTSIHRSKFHLGFIITFSVRNFLHEFSSTEY
jgi:hypothetical protein